jgi:hypothetical protein
MQSTQTRISKEVKAHLGKELKQKGLISFRYAGRTP